MRPAPLAVLLGLGLLLGLVAAQAPQVTQNLTPFAQDGGLLTVYGSGFVQRNLNQFTYTLFTGKTAAGANTPCINGCPFFCHYRSMLVNAAGTFACALHDEDEEEAGPCRPLTNNTTTSGSDRHHHVLRGALHSRWYPGYYGLELHHALDLQR